MKKLAIVTALLLSSSLAFGKNVDIKKVNQVAKLVTDSEVTETINKLEVKFDEKSNFTSAKKLNAGLTLSAAAKESVWSDSSSSLDAKATIKTLSIENEETKMEATLAVGSKTKAVSLYSYLAGFIAKDYENEQNPTETDKEIAAWFKEASLTTTLDAIPLQLEKLVVLIKKSLLESTPENPDESWDNYVKLLNSLVVDTRINNFKTVEVILKTTTEVVTDGFTVSDISFKISESGMSLGGKVVFTALTENVTAFFESAKEFLISVQEAQSEMIDELRHTARSYVQLTEQFVKGEM